MKSKEATEQEIQATGIQVKFNKKTAKAAYEHLNDSERIVTILDGNDRLGILTNERVVCLHKKPFSGTDIKDLPLSKINAVEIESSMLYKEVKVKASNMTIDIPTGKAEANRFKEAVNNEISNAKESNSSGSSDDIPAKIEKLAELKEKGILSEEEFNEQKTKLLSQL